MLEAAKRDSIPEETIKVWFGIAKEMNWSESDLDKKMGMILKRKSFGNDTVRIDDFFTDEKTYTESEVKLFINRKIVSMIKIAENILHYQGKDTDPRAYFMDFFNIKELEIKVMVADAVHKRWEYERQVEIETMMEAEISRELEEYKRLRKRLSKLSLQKKQNIIRLLEERKIISVKSEREMQIFIKNIGIFANDLTEEDLKTISQGE